MKLEEIFDQKAGFYKDHLNEYVLKHIAFGKIILDVGCSGGVLGKYLKQHKKATVFGVDISEKAVGKAKKNLDEVHILNIETDSLPFPKKSFDIIICADILEHLYDALFVLKKLKAYLKDDGILVLSIPNIANIKTRWNMLLGRFDYQKSGIMDESHLRFFTQKTTKKLVTDAGMKILKIDYSPGFSFLFLQGRIMKYKTLRNLQYKLTKIAPSLFCAQFIIVARP